MGRAKRTDEADPARIFRRVSRKRLTLRQRVFLARSDRQSSDLVAFFRLLSRVITMPKRNQRSAKKAIPRMRGGTLISKGVYSTSLSSNSLGVSSTNYPSGNFGLQSTAGFYVVTPNLVQTTTSQTVFMVRPLSLKVQWLPSFGRSSGISGSGFAGGGAGFWGFQNQTSVAPSGVTLNTVACLRNSSPIYVGKPANITWRPIALNDRMWTYSNQALFESTTEYGFQLLLYFHNCDISITLGDLIFEWVLESKVC